MMANTLYSNSEPACIWSVEVESTAGAGAAARALFAMFVEEEQQRMRDWLAVR
jgi:hypothetical protein